MCRCVFSQNTITNRLPFIVENIILNLQKMSILFLILEILIDLLRAQVCANA